MDGPQTIIDLKRLAAEVSVQHGIRVDPDDPMMAVVTLNRLVFEQAVGQVLERVQESVRDFETAADKVQVRAGAALAQEVRDCGEAMKQEAEKALEEFRGVGTRRWADSVGLPSTSAGQKWIVLGLALAISLFGLGVWVGARAGLSRADFGDNQNDASVSVLVRDSGSEGPVGFPRHMRVTPIRSMSVSVQRVFPTPECNNFRMGFETVVSGPDVTS